MVVVVVGQEYIAYFTCTYAQPFKLTLEARQVIDIAGVNEYVTCCALEKVTVGFGKDSFQTSLHRTGFQASYGHFFTREC